MLRAGGVVEADGRPPAGELPRRLVAPGGGGVDPAGCCPGFVTTFAAGGSALMRAGPTWFVTIGFDGISCGLTVRVEIGTWVGSLDQSLQLVETFR